MKSNIVETVDRFTAMLAVDEKTPGLRLRVDREGDELTILTEETTLPERVLVPHAARVQRHEAMWLTEEQVRWLHTTLGKLIERMDREAAQ